jgi:hypothetical protein
MRQFMIIGATIAALSAIPMLVPTALAAPVNAFGIATPGIASGGLPNGSVTLACGCSSGGGGGGATGTGGAGASSSDAGHNGTADGNSGAGSGTRTPGQIFPE